MTPALYRTARQIARQAQKAFPDVDLTLLEEHLARGLMMAVLENEAFEKLHLPAPSPKTLTGIEGLE